MAQVESPRAISDGTDIPLKLEGRVIPEGITSFSRWFAPREPTLGRRSRNLYQLLKELQHWLAISIASIHTFMATHSSSCAISWAGRYRSGSGMRCGSHT